MTPRLVERGIAYFSGKTRTMTAVRAARLFDGDTLVDHPVHVVVENGLVTRVGDPGDVQVTDLGDVTLLPGLVDSHTHLAFDPAADLLDDMTSASDETLLARMRAHVQAAHQAGITTLRDLGDRGYLGLALRPDVLVAGPPITSEQGHCWFLGGAVAGAGLRAAVREHVDRGVDVIKVMVTGGHVTPGSAAHESQFDLAALREVVDEAHAAGLRVTGHAHGGQGIADAVRAGMDGIEHGTFLTPSGAVPDWAVVAELAAAEVYVGVTLSGTVRSPRLETVRRMYARMRREGVRLVCASDAGVGRKTHDLLPRVVAEFAEFTEATNVEALRAVTSLAAESCGVGDRKGRIRPGFDADLLAVAGNPVRDLAVLTDVRAVYRGGKAVLHG
ncbi:amidohydrolase family protein [Kibdelosporangium lantanae]